MELKTTIDLIACASALLAAIFWFAATDRRLRRISRFERLDHADLNRMVVAMNRSQILNRRAAAASGISALCVAARLALDAIERLG